MQLESAGSFPKNSRISNLIFKKMLSIGIRVVQCVQTDGRTDRQRYMTKLTTVAFHSSGKLNHERRVSEILYVCVWVVVYMCTCVCVCVCVRSPARLSLRPPSYQLLKLSTTFIIFIITQLSWRWAASSTIPVSHIQKCFHWSSPIPSALRYDIKTPSQLLTLKFPYQ